MAHTYVDVRYAIDAPPIRDIDLARGHYLCEVCQDAMTNDVLPAAQSPTGVEMAICPGCRLTQGR